MARSKGQRSNKLLAECNRKGRRLSPAQQETVIMMYHTIGTISGTSRELGLTEGTVRRCLAMAEESPQLATARASALTQVAGKINGMTHQILDSITPEELDSSQMLLYNDKGQPTKYQLVGPSLKDKALSVAILTDKQKVLTETNSMIHNPLLALGGNDVLAMPDSLDETRRLIAQKVKRLRVMDIEFESGDTGQRINMALNRRGIKEEDIAEAEMVGEPFD